MKASLYSPALFPLLFSFLLLPGGCDKDDDESADGIDGGATNDTSTGGDLGDGDSNGDGCGTGADDSGEEECVAYTDCVQLNCDADYQTCFGAGYKNGDFTGGTCEVFFMCVFDCDCDAACIQGCTPSAECQSCQQTLGTCALNSCSAELMECGGRLNEADAAALARP